MIVYMYYFSFTIFLRGFAGEKKLSRKWEGIMEQATIGI